MAPPHLRLAADRRCGLWPDLLRRSRQPNLTVSVLSLSELAPLPNNVCSHLRVERSRPACTLPAGHLPFASLVALASDTTVWPLLLVAASTASRVPACGFVRIFPGVLPACSAGTASGQFPRPAEACSAGPLLSRLTGPCGFTAPPNGFPHKKRPLASGAFSTRFGVPRRDGAERIGKMYLPVMWNMASPSRC